MRAMRVIGAVKQICGNWGIRACHRNAKRCGGGEVRSTAGNLVTLVEERTSVQTYQLRMMFRSCRWRRAR